MQPILKSTSKNLYFPKIYSWVLFQPSGTYKSKYILILIGSLALIFNGRGDSYLSMVGTQKHPTTDLSEIQLFFMI